MTSALSRPQHGLMPYDWSEESSSFKCKSIDSGIGIIEESWDCAASTLPSVWDSHGPKSHHRSQRQNPTRTSVTPPKRRQDLRSKVISSCLSNRRGLFHASKFANYLSIIRSQSEQEQIFIIDFHPYVENADLYLRHS